MKSRFFKIGHSFKLSNRVLGSLWREFETWQRSSGKEWTVKRLKYLKLITLGNVSVPDDSGYLTGAWGHFVRNTSVPLRAKMTMIDIYLSLKSSKPTETQLDKFYSSLLREAGGEYKLNPRTTSKLLNLIEKRRIRYKAKVLFHPYSHQKSIPSFGTGPRLSQRNLGKDLVNFMRSEPLSAWFNRYRDIMESDSMLSPETLNLLSHSVVDSSMEYVGEIQYIQEGGYKLRAIANPILTGQWLLEPLKVFLFDMLKGIPEDCTFDQGKGIRAVKDHVAAGKTSYCFDLSDATNNIPYTFVKKAFDVWLVKYMSRISVSTEFYQLESQIRLFESFVHGKWLTPEGKTVTFTRGQPLGLGPSFALLALSHHMVMWECDAKPGSYAILGDDIVIFEEDLAKRYKEYMTQGLEVPMSEDKSIISDVLAEFAGKVITRNSVLSKYRWDPIRVTNVIDVLKYHGTQAFAWVPEKYLSAAVTISSLPRHLGGLGWDVPARYEHHMDHVKRVVLLDRYKEEPDMYYVSKTRRARQVEGEIASEVGLRANWSAIFSHDGLIALDKHRWYNVHYSKGLPKGAAAHYLLSNNPAAPTSSTLVRQFLKLE